MLEIQSTLREQPLRLVIYGRGGVGKSTFCSKFPGVVFIPVENGLANIDAKATRQPTSWEDFLSIVRELATDDRFQAIAIDSLDAAEMLSWHHVAKFIHKKPDVSSVGFKDGYASSLVQFRVLLNELEIAHRNGKAILLIAQATRKNIQNPMGDNYQSYAMKLYDGPAASVFGLIREWVDIVAFAQEDVAVDADKRKAYSTGKRYLHLQPKAGYDAKTRYALPDSIDFEYPVFEQAMREASFTRIPEMKRQVSELLSEVPDLTPKVESFLASRANSVDAYTQAIELLKERVKQTKEFQKTA